MDWRKQFNLPNTLTLIRIFAIPFMAREIMSGGKSITAFIFFVLIWLTDAVDGYIARKYDLVTDLGTVLDPFADKLFQIVTAYSLYRIGVLPLWIPLFLFIKDAFLLLGGSKLLHEGFVMPSRFSGKLATFLLALGFGLLLILPDQQHIYANIFIYGSLVMGVVAFVSYFLTFVQRIRSDNVKSIDGKSQGD